jgi:3-isopropylmalate/(R)-2-methylmalate dehydratase small subunit
LEPFRKLRSRYVVLPQDNIDTDQIIPARFLTVTSREGLGVWLFANWARGADDAILTDFPLSSPAARGAQILVAGKNFGCGSSREHAAWALIDRGFRAVVTTSTADIFRANALKNGLLPVVVSPDMHRQLVHGDGEISIDLEACEVVAPSGDREIFLIDAFSRYCLLNGLDELDALLEREDDISRYERERGALADDALHEPARRDPSRAEGGVP